MSSKLRSCATLEAPMTAVVIPCASRRPSTTINEDSTITKVYEVASKAKSKLGDEADRSNRNLRRMVGHANLLDSLMVKLFDAEIVSEDWIDQDVHEASAKVASRCYQWIDRILDDLDDDDIDDQIDSDTKEYSATYEDNGHLFNSPLCRVASRTAWSHDDVVKLQEIEVFDEKGLVETYENLIPTTLQCSPPKILEQIEPTIREELISNVVIIQTSEIGVEDGLVASF